jgi:hypothetical protein
VEKLTKKLHAEGRRGGENEGRRIRIKRELR